jgi:predicted PurR-regulated permease PerM
MADRAPTTERPSAGSPILTAGSIVLAIGSLYFGRDIFVPFALAILLSFALNPLVNLFRRWSIPRIAAVLIAVSIAFVFIAAIAFVVGRQLVQLADNLPKYQTTISQKIHALQESAPGGGIVKNVTSTIEDLTKELSGEEDPGKPRLNANAPDQQPVTVRLEPPQPKPLDLIRSIVGPLLAPLATAGLVVIFVIFVLLEREDLRDRFIKLAGAGDLQKSTQAINDAAARVSKYLLMQFVVNLTYGIPIGIGLYFVGVPNSILWGLLAAVLRFIPYLGPFLAALFPIALAIAVDPGWSMLFWVVGLFLTAELVSNNVIEPWLYGSSTGLSSLAIIIAAIFWTTLWGPVGLFLATPLTVCLVVIGRYVPQLEFLGVLLGSDPVLAPEEQMYQRLLAGNVEEAVEMAESYVDECSSIDLYDNIAIPALRLAENDRRRSGSDIGYRRQVADTAIFVVHEVADHVGERRSSARLADGDRPQPPRVLCLAGRTELDHAAAEMTSQALEEHDISAKVLPPIAASPGALGQLDLAGVEVVCLCYLHMKPQVYARYILRRLRRRAPHIKLIACCWNLAPESEQAGDLAKQMGADAVFVSLRACIEQVNAWLGRSSSDDGRPVIRESEQLHSTELDVLESLRAKREKFDQELRRLAETCNVPLALISFVNEIHPIDDVPHGVDGGQSASHESSLDAHVIASNDLFVCEDVGEDARFAADSRVLEKGVRFYAGAPLRIQTGQVVGTISLVDTEPHEFSDRDRRHLEEAADAFMADN